MNQKLNENRGCIVYDLDSHYTKVTGQHILEALWPHTHKYEKMLRL